MACASCFGVCPTIQRLLASLVHGPAAGASERAGKTRGVRRDVRTTECFTSVRSFNRARVLHGNSWREVGIGPQVQPGKPRQRTRARAAAGPASWPRCARRSGSGSGRRRADEAGLRRSRCGRSPRAASAARARARPRPPECGW